VSESWVDFKLKMARRWRRCDTVHRSRFSALLRKVGHSWTPVTVITPETKKQVCPVETYHVLLNSGAKYFLHANKVGPLEVPRHLRCHPVVVGLENAEVARSQFTYSQLLSNEIPPDEYSAVVRAMPDPVTW
jgi:hypothetical protein